MKFKQIIFTTFFLIATVCSNSQTTVNINYTDSSTLNVNGVNITGSTIVQDIIKKLGTPDKVIDYPRNEKSYFYETLGMVIMTMDSTVKGVGVNFNWDGDKKFPKTSYSGQLTVNNVSISKDANISSMKAAGFECPMSMMCVSNNKNAKTVSTVAFNDSNLITQIVFVLR